MNPQVYDKMFRMGFVPVLCAAGAAAAVVRITAVFAADAGGRRLCCP